MEKFTLKDDSISLIPLEESDYEILYSVAEDPEIWKHHPQTDRYTETGFATYFDKLIHCDLAFLIKDNNRIIGATSFYDFDFLERQVTIGYTFLAKSYWGTGTNKKVKTLLLKKAFEFVDTVIFHVGVSNLVSQKALLNIAAIKTENDSKLSNDDNTKYVFSIHKNDYLK